MNVLDLELSIAVEAVTEAARFAEKIREASDDANNMIKADCSPVTVADFGVQAIIHRHLAGAFPEDPIVAEEDADALRENATLMGRLTESLSEMRPGWSGDEIIKYIDMGGYGGGPNGRFWTLDPIDGTKGFIRGDQYAIALALIENGRPVLGVLGCPHFEMSLTGGGDSRRGWILAAGAGQPRAIALADGASQVIHVSGVTDPSEIRLCESVESGHSKHDTSAMIAQELGIHHASLRMDSQAKYAAVATGMADAYFRLPTRKGYEEKIWDHAAGMFVLTRAGGRVSDVRGQPLDFSQGRTLKMNAGVIATADAVHDRVLAKVKPHYAD